MTEIHHHYAAGADVEVSHTHVNDPVAGAPDADTKEVDIVQAAAVIAAAYVARNYEKNGDGTGQYSQDTIARLSVQLAEKIHAAVHGTE